MKTGRTLLELAQEIERQKTAKHDYAAPTSLVSMLNDGTFDINQEKPFSVTALAHEQLATFADIPNKYYKRMLHEDPTLLATNVNTWMHRKPETRMIRTLDGTMRAFLSDKYRPLDNDALLEAALPPLLELGVEIMSCEVTTNRLYLKVVDKRIMKDIPTGRKLGDGSHVFFDTISPALVLSNSEVGLGALSVQTSVFTHLCTNLAVVSERSTRKYHVGRRMDIGEEVYALLSDGTRRLTDAALWAQIGDVVRKAFDLAQFDAIASKISEASNDPIEGDPIKVVELTAKKHMWSAGETSSVLQHLIKNGDLTRYGLHAAVTRTAEDIQDYDRATSFEQLGGKIIELTQNEWSEYKLAA
jgi:hypothetical protein